MDDGYEEEPLWVFFSYSRFDIRQRRKLAKHLAPLERIGLIRTWDDNKILPGAQFNQVIPDKLAEADIIVVLISANYTESDYCCEIELPLAIARHENGEACVLPILISEIYGWEELPNRKRHAGKVTLGDLNVLPSNAKAISMWRPNDNGWKNVAEGIARVVKDENRKRQPRSPL